MPVTMTHSVMVTMSFTGPRVSGLTKLGAGQDAITSGGGVRGILLEKFVHIYPRRLRDGEVNQMPAEPISREGTASTVERTGRSRSTSIPTDL